MKNRFGNMGAILLMAGAMAFAQNSQSNTDTQSGSAGTPQEGTSQKNSDIPAAKQNQSQGETNQANPNDTRPGAMGTPETPKQSAEPQQGERPATGTQNEKEKGTTDNNDTRPGTTTQPDNNGDHNDSGNPTKNMSSDSSTHTPDYAKPIDQNRNMQTGDTNNTSAPATTTK